MQTNGNKVIWPGTNARCVEIADFNGTNRPGYVFEELEGHDALGGQRWRPTKILTHEQLQDFCRFMAEKVEGLSQLAGDRVSVMLPEFVAKEAGNAA